MQWSREVFFLGGFDPRGPARDHRRWAQAVKAHPVTSAGESVQCGPRERVGPLADAWRVDWQEPSLTVRSRVSAWRWDDVVRGVWPRSAWQAWRDRLRVYGLPHRHGVFGPLWRHSRAGFWLALFPLGIGAVTGLLAIMLAVGAQALGAPGGPSTVVASVAWLWAWHTLERRLEADWLLRLWAFTWRQGRREVPGLDERLDALADQLVARARASEARELLVVGHSTGSQLAVAVLARALRRAPWLGERGPELALLTLGHSVSVLGWVREAQWFRDDVALLADHAALTWHDVSAPTDWAALSRVAPWGRSGRARLAAYSPRFHATMGRGDYDALLAHRHELHQQYLRAPRHAGGYDPVVWINGPQTLAQRHAALGHMAPA